jgi:SAM-dependent methyltransferase
MTLDVLSNKQQIVDARRELRRRSLSYATPQWKEWLLRHRLLSGIRIGDALKSWDVLRTVDLIENRVAKYVPVLDIGAYASEVPPILHRLGYQHIVGLDLNSDIAGMPFADQIDYREADFLRAPFPDEFFGAITAISVIEHGFQGETLAAEMSRLLRPGGLFIASFDYWPEKIATDGIDLFGMSWMIFSRLEIENFIATAGRRGLRPFGPMNFASRDKPVSCFDRDYTFAWMVLQKQ